MRESQLSERLTFGVGSSGPPGVKEPAAGAPVVVVVRNATVRADAVRLERVYEEERAGRGFGGPSTSTRPIERWRATPSPRHSLRPLPRRRPPLSRAVGVAGGQDRGVSFLRHVTDPIERPSSRRGSVLGIVASA
jgi:hypothetical protein